MQKLIPLLCASWLSGVCAISLGANDQTSLQELMPAFCDYTGQFVQTRRLQNVPVPLVTSGRLMFSCTAGLVWQATKPINETLIYTQKGTHFRLNAQQILTRLGGISQQHLARMLSALMGADSDYLSSAFAIDPPGNSDDAVRLLPQTDRISQFIDFIELRKTPEGLHVMIQNARQETTELAITDLQEQAELTRANCHQHFPRPQPVCNALLRPQSIEFNRSDSR